MSLLVISDLHVLGPQDPLYPSFLRIIREEAGPGDTLVLAGDIFDLFVGNKAVFLDRFSEFFNEVTAASIRGVRIHYIEGNHDFLMKGAFRDDAQISVHSHQMRLEFGGRRFYLAHGDLANPCDYGYRLLRWFFRSLFVRGLIKIFPGNWVSRIGQGLSRRNDLEKLAEAEVISDERKNALRMIYRSFAADRLAEGFDHVILGHCHDLDEMEFRIADRTGQYINVGYPRVHGSYLIWKEGMEKVTRTPITKADHKC